MSDLKTTGGRRIARALWIVAVVAVAGCTSHPETFSANDPKHVLNEYISQSFAVKSVSDRDKLQNLLTGDAKNRLTSWSEDQFREAFMESKRQFVKLVFTESKSQSPQSVSLTYELSYIDQAKGHDAKVTQKKLAQMVEKSGQWLIADVKNIKELVEYREEMTLP